MNKVSLWSLTCAEALLQKANLLTERVDAVELLEGVGQQGGFLRQALIQRQWEEAAERGQHQLQLLHTGIKRRAHEGIKKKDYYSTHKQKKSVWPN